MCAAPSGPSLLDRYRGALLGLACGDAVGTTVEFRPRGSFRPLTDMVGGGPFHLQPGQWTDDTSMALCLAESLVERRGFDAHDQMTRYLKWYRSGYWSATGECFDVGDTTSAALQAFELSGEPYSGPTHARSAGNGSLMRLVPVVLHAHPDVALVRRLAADSSRTTHGAPEAVECCELYALLLARALDGAERDALTAVDDWRGTERSVAEIAAGGYLRKPAAEIAGTGHCVRSLEAALWCFHSTPSFEAAVLAAANLGDDADTTAAIAGQIAGAHYGVQGIPERWLERLHLREAIQGLADRLHGGRGGALR
jgi:ADP-ribosyl-[dinitrogen reductase] hydrolase